MSDGSAVNTEKIYLYDGSFNGLLCGIFASFKNKEVPSDITVDAQTFLPSLAIETDLAMAQRVKKGIQEKLGVSIFENIKLLFLTSAEKKERLILLYIHKGFSIGKGFERFLDDEIVCLVNKQIKYLFNERHKILMFLRFSDFNGALIATIAPNNFILPLIKQHFISRFPRERFLIFDENHGMALIYEEGKSIILPMVDYQMPDPTPEEQKYRKLFKLFYDTIEIPARRNLKLRMSHMPKRYWKNMVEMNDAFDDDKNLS